MEGTTLEYGKIAYTIYVRMVKHMLGNEEVSSFYAKPSKLDIFEDSKAWEFDLFDLGPRRQFEVSRH